MIYDIQQEILKLKKEKDICILAHSYQAHEILEVADYVGDSFQLSVMATKAPQKTVIMCGVRFMAETVKLLSPQKTVLLSNSVAGCPMAEQMTIDQIMDFKAEHSDYTVVAYINTTTQLKTVCDVCVTSSSAVKIVKKLKSDKIYFIPDCNLGRYVSEQVPEKHFEFFNGGCPIHAQVTEKEAIRAKYMYPNAQLLVHPECVPAVVKHADFIGSTSAIMDYAKKSDVKEFIIGTENSIAEHLQYECPDKRFYYLSKTLVCHNMKATTLMDVLGCVKGTAGEEIKLSDDMRKKASVCIDKMIELG